MKGYCSKCNAEYRDIFAHRASETHHRKASDIRAGTSDMASERKVHARSAWLALDHYDEQYDQAEAEAKKHLLFRRERHK